MKKIAIFLMTAFILIVCIGIAINSNTSREHPSDNTSANIQSTTSEQTKDEDTNNTIVIPSERYYEIIESTCKTAIENEDYIIKRISTLRAPYYHIECESTNIDRDAFKETALSISENIYNELLKYEYRRSFNIFAASHTIISITFSGETTAGKNVAICIQFDITNIDRNKPFLENLITPIDP